MPRPPGGRARPPLVPRKMPKKPLVPQKAYFLRHCECSFCSLCTPMPSRARCLASRRRAPLTSSPAIARHSAITGNKPANQEGQLVAVDNRADLLRTLLFLGALGLYAMDIAPLIACFSFDKHINEGNGQRGPCAIAPALIAAANSSCLRSATGLSASPRQ